MISALSRRMPTDISSKTNELFKVAELRYFLSTYILTEDEIRQILLDVVLGRGKFAKAHVEAQSKELVHKKQRMEEHEENERVANENVEGLMLDIAAAEEEITRWKVAAQQEADAGKAVEQESVAQVAVGITSSGGEAGGGRWLADDGGGGETRRGETESEIARGGRWWWVRSGQRRRECERSSCEREEKEIIAFRKYHFSNTYSTEEFGFVRSYLFHGMDPYQEMIHSISSREVMVRSSR
ncbi:hypothetical protein LguiB_033273 [Lonicera macranthoides]